MIQNGWEVKLGKYFEIGLKIIDSLVNGVFRIEAMLETISNITYDETS